MGYPHRGHADRTRKCRLRDADLALESRQEIHRDE
jgi:hypothetical protein